MSFWQVGKSDLFGSIFELDWDKFGGFQTHVDMFLLNFWYINKNIQVHLSGKWIPLQFVLPSLGLVSVLKSELIKLI